MLARVFLTAAGDVESLSARFEFAHLTTLSDAGIMLMLRLGVPRPGRNGLARRAHPRLFCSRKEALVERLSVEFISAFFSGSQLIWDRPQHALIPPT